MNYIKDIKIKENGNYNIIIEIPKGTNKKFELVEPKNDKVKCVRKVHGIYPFYYGCFPQTFAGDKDPLDAILISKKKYKSLDIASVKVIGVIKTIDAGEIDDKIITIDGSITEKKAKRKFKRIIHFLHKYKGEKYRSIIDKTFYNKEVAENILKQSQLEFEYKDATIKFKEITIDGTLR